MRLDKFICDGTALTRSLAKKALRRGDISCDGTVVKDPGFKVTENTCVRLEGEEISLVGPRYLMLNKPVNTICSTQGDVYPSVMSLLGLSKLETLHIAGRLDADTTGLVLITSDGQWSHRITSPKKGHAKRYAVHLADPIDNSLVAVFAAGVELRNEDGITKPALLEIIDSRRVRLTLSEGKYHQVKRMFAAVGNNVVGLHRESMGEIELDPALELGEWRYLTAAEIASV
jgi:16S rRNA pseudouridine516 synthase